MSKVLAIGLPEAGKTTFLAALWHVAEGEEVFGSLRLDRISEDAKHLNAIKNDWLSFQVVGHTNVGQEKFTSLHLRDEKFGSLGEIIFPDLSGEAFERAWVYRNWTKEYDEAVASAAGLLLFIHPGGVKEPYTVADMQKMVEAAFPEEIAVQDETNKVSNNVAEARRATEWEPEKAPTQVQLVEILQFVNLRIRAKQPVRLAVIISAWDLVRKNLNEHIEPQDWLAQRLPYLEQYLRSNFEQFTVRVYGVSAQGGDLRKDREQLRKFQRASERIIIDGPECAQHDISEPVRWTLNLPHSA